MTHWFGQSFWSWVVATLAALGAGIAWGRAIVARRRADVARKRYELRRGEAMRSIAFGGDNIGLRRVADTRLMILVNGREVAAMTFEELYMQLKYGGYPPIPGTERAYRVAELRQEPPIGHGADCEGASFTVAAELPATVTGPTVPPLPDGIDLIGRPEGGR